MTLTLELSSETEAKLAAQAKTRGLSLNAFVQEVVVMQAAAAPTDTPAHDQSGDIIDEIFDSIPVPPGVGQGAMQRKNWY